MIFVNFFTSYQLRKGIEKNYNILILRLQRIKIWSKVQVGEAFLDYNTVAITDSNYADKLD